MFHISFYQNGSRKAWCLARPSIKHGENVSPFQVPFNEGVNGYGDWVRSIGGKILTGENRTYRRKPSFSATFVTTNPKWIRLRLNPDLRGGKPSINRLSQLFLGKLAFLMSAY